MVQHETPVVSGAEHAALADTDSPTPASARSRWAISRGALLALMAVLLPAAASLLAAVLTADIAYHLRSGALMLETGAILDQDTFTFTAFGEPWLNQQWAASVLFAAVYDAAGWLGLLVLRAVIIGATFGLIYSACRGVEASRMVAALVTLGAFLVAATNLALRSQLFGALFFAAVVAILVWRRRHPWLLLLIPLLMVAWANTHGSFFMGWAAIGLAFLEDLLARRRRLAAATFAVGALSVLATLVTPWGVEMWVYVVELSSNPVIAALVSEWQAPTLRSATGIFFFASVALVAGLLLYRGRVISWLQVLWLGGLILLSLMAARSVIWWAIGAAPVVAILLTGLEIRGRRVGDPAYDQPSGVGYTAIAGLLIVLTLAVVPFYRPSDAALRTRRRGPARPARGDRGPRRPGWSRRPALRRPALGLLAGVRAARGAGDGRHPHRALRQRDLERLPRCRGGPCRLGADPGPLGGHARGPRSRATTTSSPSSRHPPPGSGSTRTTTAWSTAGCE